MRVRPRQQPMSRLEYTIRESARAKHVRLQISVYNASLTVVVPRGFDRRRLPEVIEEKRPWIARTRKRLAEQREQAERSLPDALPEQVHLRAVGQEWQVEYQTKSLPRVVAVETCGRTLVIRGNTSDADACKRALRDWLHRRARAELVPWLLAVSVEQALPVSKVQIRSQRTRWGSCSQRGTISINRKLLLLPARLVEHVFIHELCHTLRLDHSRKFWSLVRTRVPHYQDLEAELRTAWRYVPMWMDGNTGPLRTDRAGRGGCR